MQNIENTEEVIVDKEKADDYNRNTQEPPATPQPNNVRKEIIKNLKHHTFIGYVRKVSNGNVKIVLDIFKVINIPYSSKCGNTVKEVPILQYANWKKRMDPYHQVGKF